MTSLHLAGCYMVPFISCDLIIHKLRLLFLWQERGVKLDMKEKP